MILNILLQCSLIDFPANSEEAAVVLQVRRRFQNNTKKVLSYSLLFKRSETRGSPASHHHYSPHWPSSGITLSVFKGEPRVPGESKLWGAFLGRNRGASTLQKKSMERLCTSSKTILFLSSQTDVKFRRLLPPKSSCLWFPKRRPVGAERRIYLCFASSHEELSEATYRFHLNMIVWNLTRKPEQLWDFKLVSFIFFYLCRTLGRLYCFHWPRWENLVV